MRKIARAVFVAVASVAATPFAADAEPMMLTNSQMEAVTAAALIEVNVPITLVTGDFQSNVNLTTQVANAVALAFATCGVCTDGAPAASSSGSAGNFADSAQNQQ
jgi:hypothetical protein